MEEPADGVVISSYEEMVRKYVVSVTLFPLVKAIKWLKTDTIFKHLLSLNLYAGLHGHWPVKIPIWQPGVIKWLSDEFQFSSVAREEKCNITWFPNCI